LPVVELFFSSFFSPLVGDLRRVFGPAFGVLTSFLSGDFEMFMELVGALGSFLMCSSSAGSSSPADYSAELIAFMLFFILDLGVVTGIFSYFFSVFFALCPLKDDFN
jgi:hypothetical protein